jgi:hypothetical protein
MAGPLPPSADCAGLRKSETGTDGPRGRLFWRNLRHRLVGSLKLPLGPSDRLPRADKRCAPTSILSRPCAGVSRRLDRLQKSQRCADQDFLCVDSLRFFRRLQATGGAKKIARVTFRLKDVLRGGPQESIDHRSTLASEGHSVTPTQDLALWKTHRISTPSCTSSDPKSTSEVDDAVVVASEQAIPALGDATAHGGCRHCCGKRRLRDRDSSRQGREARANRSAGRGDVELWHDAEQGSHPSEEQSQDSASGADRRPRCRGAGLQATRTPCQPRRREWHEDHKGKLAHAIPGPPEDRATRDLDNKLREPLCARAQLHQRDGPLRREGPQVPDGARRRGRGRRRGEAAERLGSRAPRPRRRRIPSEIFLSDSDSCPASRGSSTCQPGQTHEARFDDRRRVREQAGSRGTSTWMRSAPSLPCARLRSGASPRAGPRQRWRATTTSSSGRRNATRRSHAPGRHGRCRPGWRPR